MCFVVWALGTCWVLVGGLLSACLMLVALESLSGLVTAGAGDADEQHDAREEAKVGNGVKKCELARAQD